MLVVRLGYRGAVVSVHSILLAFTMYIRATTVRSSSTSKNTNSHSDSELELWIGIAIGADQLRQRMEPLRLVSGLASNYFQIRALGPTLNA